MSDDTPWLTPAELHGWVVLSAALAVLPEAVDDQLKRDAGLNFFEYSVLGALVGAPGQAMQMWRLAAFSRGTPSRLSHAISRMERAGWVERRTGTTGSRAVEAVLTEAGRDKVVQAAPQHVREVRRLVVDALTSEELTQLTNILRKVLAVTDPPTLALIDDTVALHGSGQSHPS